MAYLDHAGAGKPTEKQMKLVAEDILRMDLSNPHSKHQSGKYTAAVVDRVRARILRHFNVSSDTHAVAFTSGTTHSLQLIAESFNFGERLNDCVMKSDLDHGTRGVFVYMKDAHTSAVGMREIVRDRCNAVCVVSFDDLQNLHPESDTAECASSSDLFVITAMSNFCGRKYPLDVIEKIHKRRPGRSYVCLDAAALVSSSHLDLSKYQADFVAFSFYKIFGFPTGIGALIVRRESCDVLQKRFFGGGTVRLLVPDQFAVFRKADFTQRFEDGTINYWSIAALEHGFQDLESFGGMAEIEKHTHMLACKLRDVLNSKYENGAPVAKIYEHKNSRSSSASQGPIVTFNILRDNGSYVGYAEVDKMCSLYGIELRTGCFCNQGACQDYLQLSRDQLLANFQGGKECGDSMDLHDGKPIGAVRASFGRQSSIEDVKLFERMLKACFLSARSITQLEKNEVAAQSTLRQIALFPVKSCTAVTPQSWRISPTGLEYDRLWMVTSPDGVYLSLKTAPQLHLIKPEVENENLVLCSRLKGISNITVPLRPDQQYSSEEQRVCSDRVETMDCGDEVAEWISDMLNIDGCRLRRKIEHDAARICSLQDSSKPPIGLSNEAPYLLINKESVAHLASIAGLTTEEAVKRFRANFVVDGIEAYSEDKIARIQIGEAWFKVVGKCTRCQIICVDPETGEKDPAVLVALRDQRIGSKITFGIYLQHDEGSEGKQLSIGMPVNIVWQ